QDVLARVATRVLAVLDATAQEAPVTMITAMLPRMGHTEGSGAGRREAGRTVVPHRSTEEGARGYVRHDVTRRQAHESVRLCRGTRGRVEGRALLVDPGPARGPGQVHPHPQRHPLQGPGPARPADGTPVWPRRDCRLWAGARRGGDPGPNPPRPHHR